MADVDVLLVLHDRDDARFDAGERMLLEVVWRDGLMPGREPPAPVSVRFDARRGGFVRVDEPEAA